MLKQFLTLILSYLNDRFSSRSQTQNLASFGLEKLRLMTMVLFAVVICLICFSSALMFLLEDMRKVYDQQQSIGFSDLSLIPLAIFAIVGAILFFSFRKASWGLIPKQENPVPPQGHQTDPITEALALLIKDFIDERKQKRSVANAKSNAPPHSTTNKQDLTLHGF